MMEYTVGISPERHPDIFSPLWEQAPVGRVAVNPWPGFAAAPDTVFQLLRDEEGLSLRMHTAENPLRAVCAVHNGDVYKDSCMEFFYSPLAGDGRYLNFECNPGGFLHLGLGESREGRQLLTEDRRLFRIQSQAEPGNWTLKLYIPDRFLLTYFSAISPVGRFNAYKCGDETLHPHYAAWSPVGTPTPDFHQPVYFGELHR